MAKSYNPADAFRKAQRAKEVKKNKEVRKKVREVQTVKRDTRDLESEIRSLRDKRDNASKSRIAELESELAYIVKTKEAYVKEHPDAKDKVFKPRGAGAGGSGRQEGTEEEVDENGASGSGMSMKARERLYDEATGRLRDPTRSAYYDPVYNPWGAPPPGMPYKERPGMKPLDGADEEDSDEEDDSDGDEIVMPEGPPPAEDGEDDDEEEDDEDDDDIPLPPGPPPPKAAPPMPPSGPSAWGGRAAPVPVPFHQSGAPPMGMPYPPFPPPVPQQQPFYPPPPPPQMQPQQPMRNFRPPRHNGLPAVVQDPLDDAPTQTYQAYHTSLPARPPPSDPNPGPKSVPGLPGSLPARPTSAVASAPVASVEISAAPVLRDLRKEATVFVPRNLKRKAPIGGLGGGAGGRINAAPGAGVRDAEGDEVVVRTSAESGLMGKLKGVLGPEVGGAAGARAGKAKASADEDYERFLAGLGEV